MDSDGGEGAATSLALVHYYIRCGLYGHAAKVASDALRSGGGGGRGGGRSRGDPILLFWRAVSVGLSGDPPRAIRELNALRRSASSSSSRGRVGASTLEYPASLALLHFHRLRRHRIGPSSFAVDNLGDEDDDDELEDLEFAVSAAEGGASAEGTCMAVRFCLFGANDAGRAGRLARTIGSRAFVTSGRGGGYGGLDPEEAGNAAEAEMWAVRCWVELASVAFDAGIGRGIGVGRDDSSTAAERLRKSDAFDRLASEDGAQGSLECLMALAEYHRILGDTTESLRCLNRATALSSERYFPACIESAKLLLSARRHDEASDAARRALSLSSVGTCAECLHIAAFVQALTEGDELKLESTLGKLVSALEEREKSNATLLARTAEVFARLSRGRAATLRRHTVRLLRDACEAEPQRASHRSELGRQLLQTGEVDRAAEEYGRAADLTCGDADESAEALRGTILCLIYKGELDDAEQQIELLSLVRGGEEDGDEAAAPELLFAEAMLAKKRGDGDAAASKFREAGRRHLEGLSLFDGAEGGVGAGSSLDVYRGVLALKPDFLFNVARHLLNGGDCFVSLYPGDDEDGGAGQQRQRQWNPDESVETGLDLLRAATDRFPAFLEARLLAAKTMLDGGRIADAEETVSSCVEGFGDESSRSGGAPAFLLASRVLVARGNADLAEQRLEEALGCDFALQNHPLYLLTRAEIAARRERFESVVDVLGGAIEMPAVRGEEDADGGGGGGGLFLLSLKDRVSCFTLLSSAFSRLKRAKEAQRVLKDARSTFSSASAPFAGIRILVQAQLQNDRPDKAVKVLGRVPHDSPAHYAAQLAKAKVHLHVRRDRRAYVKTFEELAKDRRTRDAYVRLGEAYGEAQLPEMAISAYERALETDDGPGRGDGEDDDDDDEASLVLRIGRALVDTHRYEEALSYYENAYKSDPASCGILSSYAMLCAKLGRYDRAVEIVLEESRVSDVRMEREEREGFVAALVEVARCLKAGGFVDHAESVLEEAKTVQTRWMEHNDRNNRAQNSDHDSRVLSQLCRLLGECSEAKGDFAAARELYASAIDLNGQDDDSMLHLAKLHLNLGKLDECAAHVEKVLRVNPGCGNALEVMSELLFRRGKYEDALEHQLKLLHQQPNNYLALERYVLLLWRSGRLEQAAEVFRLAEEKDPCAPSHGGFLYSKGIFYRYSNRLTDAIETFNRVRACGEREWQLRAIERMIWLYLNPSSTNLWEAIDDAGYTGNSKATQHTLESLIDELETNGASPDSVQVFRGYCLLVSEDTGCSKTAVQLFLEVLDLRPDYIPALLGMATVFMVDKSHGKARNVLKKIIRNNAGHEFSDELERSYLMLAETYCERGKLDLVQDLCKRCLLLNKSCSNAWEMMGSVLESQGQYNEAADCFSKSYDLDGKASPVFGFRLALCYFKAGKIVEAISVCSEVLDEFPDYHELRDDVLERCFAALRP